MAIAIPVLNTFETEVSTEAPATASFWTRAKARVINIAKRVASPIAAASRTTAKAVKSAAVKTASTVKRTAIKAASATKRMAKAVVAKVRGVSTTSTKTSFGQRAKDRAKQIAERMAAKKAAIQASFASPRTWASDTWTRVIRPFLKLRAVVFGILIGVVALVAAPIPTLIVGFAVGAGLWGLSYVVEYLEASSSRVARFALKAIEIIARTLQVLVYIATATFTIALCGVSLPFAMTEVLELVLRYRGVNSAVHVSSLAFFLLTGQWTLFVLFFVLGRVAYRTPTVRTGGRQSVDQQTVTPEYGNRRRVEIPIIKDGTPRRVHLPKCSACGLDDGGARFGLRNHKNLCGDCFKKLDDNDAIKAAKQGRLTKTDVELARKHGVKVPMQVLETVNNRPVNQRKELTMAEVEQLSAFVNSRDDATQVYWAETAWWYDRDSRVHTREWLGFVDGRSVAAIEYRHEKRNRGYEAWLLGATEDDDIRVGLFHTLEKENGAQDAIAEALSNQKILVNGTLDALSTETPAVPKATVVRISEAELAAACDALDAKVVETVRASWLSGDEADSVASPEERIEEARKLYGNEVAAKLEEQLLTEMIASEQTS